MKPFDLRIEYAKWRNWRHKLGLLLKQMPKPKRELVRMLDSIYVQNLPDGADAYLGYVGGRWPTFESGALGKAFPNALLMGIAISASLNAKALDIERFDATPQQAPAWTRRQHARGIKRPVLYIAASSFQTLVDLMTASGLRYGHDYYVVTAHYSYVKHICGPKTCGFGKQSAHGTQWTNKARGNNGSLVDESIVQRAIFD